MKLSTALLCGLSLVLPSVLAHPLDLPFKLDDDEILNLERRASGIVDTTGVVGATGIRYEIRQLQAKQPNQFTLFILAMKQFMSASQSDITGYYQVAGIHGVPRINYNNVGPCSGCGNQNGYCTHNSVLFPAWHRTYMALFEQEMVRVAKTIANAWPVSGQPVTRTQMQTAAKQLRLPYWDWAAHPPNNGPMIPTIVTNSQITVQGPSGSETIANPLYSYHFTDTSALVFTPFTSWPNTLRWPTSDASSATSNEQACINDLNSIRPSLQDNLYSLFTTCSQYLYFSNDVSAKQVSSPPCVNSLEGIHNTIHTISGGVPSSSVPYQGHMHYLPLAGFDPIFWLHHAMVDRIFAMWQTIHPTSYGASQVAVNATWTIEVGSTQDASSPLTPFYRSGSTFWDTDAVKNWTVFHYTYPEFVDSSGSSSAIASYINALYGPSATATAGSSKRTAAPEPVQDLEARTTPAPEVPADAQPVAREAEPEDEILATLESEITPRGSIFNPPKGAVAANGSTYEYVASIQSPRYALDGSYIVYVFLGAPASEDPSTWMTDANLVGPMGVPGDPNMQGADIQIQGAVQLTRALTKKLGSGALAQLSEDLVGPFLKNILTWRIGGPNGESVDPGSLPGFLVSVLATTASQPATIQELPKYSKLIAMPIATHGKKGGLVNSTLSAVGL